MVAPDPAARVRLVAVTARFPPEALARTIDEAPPARVIAPAVSLVSVDDVVVPVTERVPPFSVIPAESLRRLLLVPDVLLVRARVPPWFSVTEVVLVSAPLAPLRRRVP